MVNNIFYKLYKVLTKTLSHAPYIICLIYIICFISSIHYIIINSSSSDKDTCPLFTPTITVHFKHSIHFSFQIVALKSQAFSRVPLYHSRFLHYVENWVRYKCANMSISEGGCVCVSFKAGDPDTVTMTGWLSVCTIVTRCSSGSFSCSVGLGSASMASLAYLRSRGLREGRVSVTVTGGSERGARYDGGPLYSEPHHAAPVDPLQKTKYTLALVSFKNKDISVSNDVCSQEN